MNILKNSLDKTKNSELIIEKPIRRSRRNMNNILYSINQNYQLYNNDPILNVILKKQPVSRKLIIKKEKIIINREINNLNDLINLLNEYPIVSNADYNIDLERIQKIKEPLIELNSLIGIHDLKNNILDQILFYVQDLHLEHGTGLYAYCFIWITWNWKN